MERVQEGSRGVNFILINPAAFTPPASPCTGRRGHPSSRIHLSTFTPGILSPFFLFSVAMGDLRPGCAGYELALLPCGNLTTDN